MAEVQPDIAVYKILTVEEWEGLSRDGVFRGSPIDVADGFLHFSRADQVEGTLARHFADADAVVVIEVATAPLIDFMRWEESRDGELFPHLYGNFEMEQVRRHWTLERGAHGWDVPEFAGEDPEEVVG